MSYDDHRLCIYLCRCLWSNPRDVACLACFFMAVFFVAATTSVIGCVNIWDVEDTLYVECVVAHTLWLMMVVVAGIMALIVAGALAVATYLLVTERP